LREFADAKIGMRIGLIEGKGRTKHAGCKGGHHSSSRKGVRSTTTRRRESERGPAVERGEKDGRVGLCVGPESLC